MCSTYSPTNGCTVQAHATAVGPPGLYILPNPTKIYVPHLCWSLSMVLYVICHVSSPGGVHLPTTLPYLFLISCSRSPLLECNYYSLHLLPGAGVGLHLLVAHMLCGIRRTATKGMLSLPSSNGGYSPDLSGILIRSMLMDTDSSVPSPRTEGGVTHTLPSLSPLGGIYCPYPPVRTDYLLVLDSVPSRIFLSPIGLVPSSSHWLAMWVPAPIDPISLDE